MVSKNGVMVVSNWFFCKQKKNVHFNRFSVVSFPSDYGNNEYINPSNEPPIGAFSVATKIDFTKYLLISMVIAILR